MKPLSKFFLAILLLTFASTSWADVFLDAFKENYIAGENYQNYEKRLEGGQVVTLGRSAFFAEWSSFYQTKAEGMAGTLTLGKFTTNLSTVKDLAISAASADPIGAATAAAELATVLREISTQASAEDLASNPIVENLIKVYEVVGTAADTAGVAGLISPDTLSVAKLFPAHSKAAKAIAQRNEAWAKTMGVDGKAASKQLGYLSVFNVVLNETLVDSVKGEYDYQQVVWSETIALSLLADKISKLYSNYDLRGLTEDEAFQLMILERDYWQLVIKAKENEIAHEAEKGYVQKLIEVPADLYLSYYYGPEESVVEETVEEIKQQAKRRLSNIDKAMRAVSATVAAEAIAAAREKKKQEKVRLAEEKKKQEEARLAAEKQKKEEEPETITGTGTGTGLGECYINDMFRGYTSKSECELFLRWADEGCANSEISLKVLSDPRSASAPAEWIESQRSLVLYTIDMLGCNNRSIRFLPQ